MGGAVIETGAIGPAGRSGLSGTAGKVEPDGLDDLVLAARSGSRDAFTMLYHRFAPLVHGILLARVPRGEVDDLVQDVFLSAWRKLDALREPGAFGGWLASIARNHATSLSRELARTPTASGVPDGEKTIAGIEGATGARHGGPDGVIPRGHRASRAAQATTLAEAHAVLEEIARLPGAYRETLVLRLVEGMTGPEIAEKTGLTPGSVRVNLHRGLKMLKERLGEGEGHE